MQFKNNSTKYDLVKQTNDKVFNTDSNDSLNIFLLNLSSKLIHVLKCEWVIKRPPIISELSKLKYIPTYPHLVN